MKRMFEPWKVAELFRDQRVIRPAEGGYPIGAVYPQRDKHGKPHYDVEAHARLVAAAPEMYHVLVRAHQTFRNLLVGGFVEAEDSSSAQIWMTELDNLRAALAKVRGESEAT